MSPDGTALDLAALRADTPGCARVAHLNNAGASLPPSPVVERVVRHLRAEAEAGPVEAAGLVADELEEGYAALARLLGADPGEVFVSDGNARAWASVFLGLDLGPGDRILVSRAEWVANWATALDAAGRAGAAVEVIPSAPTGEVDLDAFAAMLRAGRVRLACLTWLPSNGGLVNPAAGFCALASAAGVPTLLDAAQAVGQRPVDVRAIGCDALVAPGRKFLRGPRGTAVGYVRAGFRDRLRPRVLDPHSAPWDGSRPALRGDARRFETAEASSALRLGLFEAVRYALRLGLPAIQARCEALAERLRDGLASVPGARLRDLGAPGAERSCLVSFTLDGVPARAVQAGAREAGINVAVNGEAYTPLDMAARGLDAVVRASPHCYNAEDEVDRLLEAVATVRGGVSR